MSTPDPYGSPVEALRRVLNHFLAEHSVDDAVAEWRRYASQSPEQAAILLGHLDSIVADPPEDLPSILAREGEIELEDDDGTSWSLTRQVDWLRAVIARLHSAYDIQESSPNATLRHFLQRFWLDQTAPAALEAWRSYAAESPADAQRILADLRRVDHESPAELAARLRTWGWITVSDDDAPAWLQRVVDEFAEASGNP